MKLDFDVIIIGAGPAGMTAAIYLKRANTNVVLVDGNAPGGQINKTAKIENYPGFEAIEGPALAFNMFMQTQKLKVPYKYGKVLKVIDNNDYKVVKTDKEELTCKAVIIATGRNPRELGLENEKKLTGRGISWCAICDGPLFKNKEVMVVGGGNSALEESLYLKDVVSKIYLVHRRDEFRGDKILQDRIKESSNIEIMYNSVITKINENNNILDNIEIEDVITKEKKTINVAGLFIYIGFKPATSMVNELDLNMDNDYIIVDENMRTNIKGIYACGDVIRKELYQVVTSTGEGAIAAISALKDIVTNQGD